MYVCSLFKGRGVSSLASHDHFLYFNGYIHFVLFLLRRRGAALSHYSAPQADTVSIGWDLINFVQRPCTVKFMGSFTIEDGDISENVTIKKTSVFSNFVAIISTRWKCQMSVNFHWIVFLETDPNSRRRKKSLSCCVFVLHKTSNYILTQGKNHHL